MQQQPSNAKLLLGLGLLVVQLLYCCVLCMEFLELLAPIPGMDQVPQGHPTTVRNCGYIIDTAVHILICKCIHVFLCSPDWCANDSGSCGCCTMVKELNKLENHFHGKFEVLDREYQRTKQSLMATEASRTAFSVSLFNQPKCFGPYRANQNVIYKEVFLNLGNAYSTTTGIFTVMYAGVYSIALTVYSDAGATGIPLIACATLQVNGVAVASVTDVNTNDQEDSGTTVLALQLNSGDQVSVNLPPNCYLCDDQNHYNTFSAFLLYLTA
ncbi:Complement C1q-like protein 2 C1q and tumor necrosis factor-related protein 10 [Collichthys lucidus]|uniref:Complement C1q-like protein 2 C1q and tumor necrosis factor-related protein 10 n=1 Tax=Collichthys lucidus TaxID=240159 RepID=A0A4U5V2J6_COLLU|nr:Complement C1q-like protein 2 C1q and tumor necrosis factor-related protein 10 [Collichthys lucidus]